MKRFRIGDEVEIVGKNSTAFSGFIGTIVSIEKDNGNRIYWVKFIAGGTYFYSEQLKKVN